MARSTQSGTPQPEGVGRRGLLASVAAAALTAPALAPGAARADAAAEATTGGYVFEDATGGHLVKPEGAAGVPGVLVSNGRDVVRTDAQGHWTLTARPGDSIFVIKPTGWMTPVVAGTNLPAFAYVHEPDGTPAALATRYRGLAPTGPLPARIDFALRRQAEPTTFDVLLFTDPQPESAAELDFVRDDVVAQAASVPSAFGISLGDLMFDDLSLYARSNAIVGTLGRPWYNCCGNHDRNLEAPDDRHSRDTFRREFGARYYAWQYGGVTFVALDNVEHLGGVKYRGRFGADQLGFVRNLLAQLPEDQLVVFCMHVPLRSLAGTDDTIVAADAADFLAVVGKRPFAVSFSGHTHTNEHFYLETDSETPHHHHVLTAVSGSWWSGPFDMRGIPVAVASDGAPNGFHVLSVDGNRYTTRLVAAHEPEPASMRIMLDGPFHRAEREVMKDFRMGQLLGGTVPAHAVYGTELVVNLFDGGPRSQVAFALTPDGPWHALPRVERIDPFVAELYARNEATRKPWVKAAPSTHVFAARLPPELAPGTYRVSVRATDEHGRTVSGGMVLEVVG